MGKHIIHPSEIMMAPSEADSTLNKLLVIGFPLTSFINLSYGFAYESICTTEYFPYFAVLQNRIEKMELKII